jgi:hypothetical protein
MSETEKERLEARITELRDSIKALEDGEEYDAYDEWLDEVSGDVKIGSLTYSASAVLKAVDEIAYNCGYSDYVDGELTRGKDELEELEAEYKALTEEGETEAKP